MRLKHIIKYVSAPAKIIMVLIVLLIAVLVLQGMIIQMTFVFFPEPLYTKPAESKMSAARQKQKRISRAPKMFLPDGTIHLVHTLETPAHPREDERQVEIYDVNDNLLWSGKRKDKPYHYLPWSMPSTWHEHTGLSAYQMEVNQMITPGLSRTLIVPVVSPERKITQRWRYEPSLNYFIGYDSRGSVIGYAGSRGMAKSQTRVRPFGKFEYMLAWTPRDSSSPVLLWQTEQKVYQISFEERAVEVLFDTKGIDVAEIAMNNWRRVGLEYHSIYRPLIYLTTKSGRIDLLLRDHKERLSFKIPKKWNLHSIAIAAVKDKIFLKYSGTEGYPVADDRKLWKQWFDKYRYKPLKQWVELHRIDSSGNLKLINRFDWTSPAAQKPKTNDGFVDWHLRIKTYVTPVSSPLYALAWHCHFKDAIYQGPRKEGFERATAEFFREIHPRNTTANWIIGAIMVCVMFWHHWSRRTSSGRFIFWLILVGAFNLAGFLTYLALNHTPVIRCGACGKRRGLERLDCPACNAHLPLPKQRGTDLILAKPAG